MEIKYILLSPQQKESPWEGAIRSAGLIWSPLLKQKNYVSNQVSHAIDWLPTLASAAGIQLPSGINIDGVNLWTALSEAEDPQPRRLIHVLDNVFGYSAYTRGNLKYVNGSSFQGQYDTWLGFIAEEESDPLASFYEQEVLASPVHTALGNPPLSIDLIKQLRLESTHRCPANTEDYEQEIYKCEPLKAPCFFNIDKDPCERYNLAKLYPLQIQFLSQEVDEYLERTRPSARVPNGDPLADPSRFGGVWQWWKNTELRNGSSTSISTTSSPAILGLSFFLIILIVITNNIN